LHPSGYGQKSHYGHYEQDIEKFHFLPPFNT